MNELADCIAAEAIKLRRSLILLLAVATPGMVGVLSFVFLVTGRAADEWSTYAQGGMAIWGFFMLPMAVTALSVLMAQVENGSRAWTYLASLPVRRASPMLAKHVVALGVVAVMLVLVAVFLVLSGLLASAVMPEHRLQGSIPFGMMGSTLATMFLASGAMVAVQIGIALRSASFVPPMVTGIGGTFVAVAATGAEWGNVFPWMLPVLSLAPEDAVVALAGLEIPRRTYAAVAGAGAGLVISAVMIAHLARREVRL